MGKLNPKRVDMLCHKTAVLCDLLADTLEELKTNTDFSKDFISQLNKTSSSCEKIISDVFAYSKGVRKSTYLQNLTNKIDTIVRHEYKLME